jgi:hypothetical protein
MTSVLTETSPTVLRTRINDSGFAVVPAAATRRLLGAIAPADIAAFAASWNDLALDTYMADGGRYRRRRHAVFAVSGAAVARQPDQPHYQSTEYNTLNGGVERWFEPVTEAIASGPVVAALFAACRGLFPLEAHDSWRAELHQFRIEATAETAGQPTPEGMHRDGVDWVCVLLAARTNLAEGTTQIARPDGTALGSFTLTDPFDAVFLDDHRVMHGVTAVRRLDPAKPGYRDVLVVTFKKQ